MGDFDDIAAGVADLAGDIGKDPGAVWNLQMQAQQAAVAQQRAQQHVGQDAGVDVATGDGDADLLAAEAFGIGKQGGETGGTGALRHGLGGFDQQADGFLDGAFGGDEDAGNAAAHHLERDFADVAHGDALGDGGAADGDGAAGDPLGHGGVGFDLGTIDGDAGVQGRGGDEAPGE